MSTPHNAGLRAMFGTAVRGDGATYHLVDVIGEGGQGWVFKARCDDPVDGFPVVVKVLRPDAATQDALDRFRREGEILRHLSQSRPSPYIVRFYDHGTASFPLPYAEAPGTRADLPFTVMELINGDSLADVIDKHAGIGLPLRRARRILREVQKALVVVHEQGIVHRDLKPSNILLANDSGQEVAKVTDFGLVKIVDTRMTSTQSVAGVSLSYAPPEQYEPGNARVGPVTDVFSFAAIVFELLSGVEAFPASRNNPFEALRLIASGKRPKLADRISQLPPPLRDQADRVAQIDAAIERALDPEPSRRPASIAAFWESLDALLRDDDPAIEPPPPARPPEVTIPGGSGNALFGDVGVALRAQTPAVAYVVRPAMPQATVASAGVTPIVQLGAATPIKPSTPPPPMNVGATPTVVHAQAVTLDSSDPRAWKWSKLAEPGAPGAVRDAAWSADLGELTMVGENGLFRWSKSLGWARLNEAIEAPHAAMRAVALLPNGTVAVAGERGLIALLISGVMWDVRSTGLADVTFHGLASDAARSRILAVGERAVRGHAIGVAVEIVVGANQRVHDFPDLPPLRAATATTTGFLACGDAGGLVRIDGGVTSKLAWQRSGHLRAVCASTVTAIAYAVGTGGHALSIDATSGTDRVVLDSVMTTQELRAVTIAPNGHAFAASANARVLRRDDAGVWQRLSRELPTKGHLTRIGARADTIRIVVDDGSLIEAVLG